jgi:DNA-binding NtrC family response regulator
MAWRLVASVLGRDERFLLVEGDNLVGSGDSCGVRLTHPSVSRRHAVLRMEGDRFTVEDVGSRNGSRLAGRALSGVAPCTAGDLLSFGTVQARLIEVAEDDLVVGVPLAGSKSMSPETPAPNLTTAAPSLLAGLVEHHLPMLLSRLETAGSEIEVAQAVGEALARALPAPRVDIVRLSAAGDAVLFTAGPTSESGIDEAFERDCGALRLSVHFRRASTASRLAPILELAAAVLRLGLAAQRPRRRAVPRTDPGAAVPLPDPPTLVPAVRAIYREAERIARGTISVLIRGESGTGKEVLARYLHCASARAAGPLVTLNCAALPVDLLEAELFGVERGVATGVDSRPGMFEMADGGTLFLDEIGDMSLETQARILRVLQEGEVYRLGGQRPHPARVRVISATNRDLERMLGDDLFRSDLYHRIADWVVELPPLRERRLDIPQLAAYFLAQAAAEQGVHPAGISRAAVELLTGYHWPGNIRQLQREMARAALFLADGELLESARLQPVIRSAGAATTAGGGLRDTLERVERETIQLALEASGGDVVATARRLGVGRSTLYRRMAALGLDAR